MDAVFYNNTIEKNLKRNEYIKFLERQIMILRSDNKRLIKEMEKNKKI